MNETNETDETASSLASCTAVIVLYVRMSTIARPGEPASKSLVSVQQSPRPLSRPVRIASHYHLGACYDECLWPSDATLDSNDSRADPCVSYLAQACYCYLHLMIAADRRSATPVEACASLPGLSSLSNVSCLSCRSFLVSVESRAGKRAHCKACRATLCRCQLPHPVPSCPMCARSQLPLLRLPLSASVGSLTTSVLRTGAIHR